MSERDARITREKDMRVVVRAAATILEAREARLHAPQESVEASIADAIRLLNEAKRQLA